MRPRLSWRLNRRLSRFFFDRRLIRRLTGLPTTALNCVMRYSTSSSHSWRQRGEQGACPHGKIGPDWATAWEGLLPVLRMHTLLERSYSTRTTMKRTNFPRRFGKPDLNFQKVYTRSQSSGHIRIQSEIRTASEPLNVVTALSFIFQHSKKPAKYNKKLSYRRVTARCVLSLVILPVTTQQYRNYLYDKS